MSLWGARCGKPARRVLRGEGGTRSGPRPPSTQLKLGAVISDMLSKSGRAMLEALAAGQRSPEDIAALADSRVRATRAELADALRGRLTPHQHLMLRLQLDHVRYLDQQIEAVEAEVARRLAPFPAQMTQLDTIPGVSARVAEVVLA